MFEEKPEHSGAGEGEGHSRRQLAEFHDPQGRLSHTRPSLEAEGLASFPTRYWTHT